MNGILVLIIITVIYIVTKKAIKYVVVGKENLIDTREQCKKLEEKQEKLSQKPVENKEKLYDLKNKINELNHNYMDNVFWVDIIMFFLFMIILNQFHKLNLDTSIFGYNIPFFFILLGILLITHKIVDKVEDIIWQE